MAGAGQKTEAPTSRRLQKARDEGRFPNSRLALAGLQFLIVVTLLTSGLKKWIYDLGQLLVVVFHKAMNTSDLRPSDVIDLSREVLWQPLKPLVIAGMGLVAAVLLAQLLVTRFGFATKNLTWNLNKLNPANRVMSLPRENVTNTLQAVFLLGLFLYALYVLGRDNFETALKLPYATLPAAVSIAASMLDSLLWKAVTGFVIVGLASFWWERSKYMKDLKMSKQEVKDEHKEIEGNPESKARIRRMQRDLYRRGMMKRVPEATVTIVNPTHYAVCLKYDPEQPGAPVVLAKAKNYLALRIRRISEEHHIPVIENPPLAQALYKHANIGQEIPPQFYRAVAELLAYVLKFMRSRR